MTTDVEERSVVRARALAVLGVALLWPLEFVGAAHAGWPVPLLCGVGAMGAFAAVCGIWARRSEGPVRAIWIRIATVSALETLAGFAVGYPPFYGAATGLFAVALTLMLPLGFILWLCHVVFTTRILVYAYGSSEDEHDGARLNSAP